MVVRLVLDVMVLWDVYANWWVSMVLVTMFVLMCWVRVILLLWSRSEAGEMVARATFPFRLLEGWNCCLTWFAYM